MNHIIPLALGGPDTDENTENLCGTCDKIVTAEQFGHAAPIEARRTGDQPRHPWNRDV
ncbi:HNH endonuclease [Sphingomonas sp. S2-65]|uniref:HNH endonuclease n=1 Tax=Sphingomonas sp. S2-65 TaxID=2903960 RepID=UPI001F24E9F2|nr:HNH endonuclease [Sphingomonas sp. S2-65]UYY57095.1 HNH endonuclease [Sphingomonas sp. S2-65]